MNGLLKSIVGLEELTDFVFQHGNSFFCCWDIIIGIGIIVMVKDSVVGHWDWCGVGIGSTRVHGFFCFHWWLVVACIAIMTGLFRLLIRRGGQWYPPRLCVIFIVIIPICFVVKLVICIWVWIGRGNIVDCVHFCGRQCTRWVICHGHCW